MFNEHCLLGISSTSAVDATSSFSSWDIFPFLILGFIFPYSSGNFLTGPYNFLYATYFEAMMPFFVSSLVAARSSLGIFMPFRCPSCVSTFGRVLKLSDRFSLPLRARHCTGLICHFGLLFIFSCLFFKFSLAPGHRASLNVEPCLYINNLEKLFDAQKMTFPEQVVPVINVHAIL